jgi:hypothetical protein
MATVTWTGAALDGDLGTNGNYLGGTAPSNSDTVVFDRGSENVTAGLTSGLTGLTIIGTRGYTGVIAPGSYLNAAYTEIRWAAGSANFSGNITNARFSPRADSVIGYGTGTLATGYAESCNLSIAAAAVVTNLRTLGVILDDLYNGTAYTLLELGPGSRAKTKRGGKIIAHAAASVDVLGAGVLSTGSVFRSRSVGRYLSSAAISGTVDVESGGVFDAKDNANAFTFGSGTLNVWPGARYDLNTRAGLVSPGTLNSYGLSTESDVGGATPIP